MREAGADQYTFHIEATDIPQELCRQVREAGMKVGIAVKPNTPVTRIEEFIEEADMILIMTVEPGFGGQKFMSNMMPKVRHLRQRYPNLNIEVDGGVGPGTIEECAQVVKIYHFMVLITFTDRKCFCRLICCPKNIRLDRMSGDFSPI